MYNWRKLAVSGALATTLTFSSLSVFAASFDDVSGLDSEISITKLVSLGYIANKGANFNPDSNLTRLEFAEIACRITTIGSSSVLKIKDLDTSKGKNKAAVRAVRGGLLSLNKKGEFKPKGSVTFAELSKALAFGLGFKKTWSNRPIDYLYYLDRKGVLDIDTDLDAAVTREDVAVAVDKYLTAKQSYTTITGVVSELTSTGLVVKSTTGENNLKYAANASIFQDDQQTEKGAVGPGTAVSVTLNSKGQVAYLSSTSLEVFDGAMAYDASGKLLVKGKTLYNTHSNLVVTPLPSSPDADFTFKEFANYGQNGVTFEGTAYSNMATDEITMLSPYVTKVTDRPISLNGTSVTFGFKADFDFNDLSMPLNDAAVVHLVDGTATKDVKLADIDALQKAGKVLTGTAIAGADGTITDLTVKAADPAPAE
ncbi:S-layer homology domain-containing protein [Neobacillus sp. PS3-34]|uniref:S-layer homology domain-containing protein n=1 Tax=Neobacillus sp. PS3-34 TaxID=3070678 RepID=UPI0027DF14A6|nr:S-layer homology domain-containing protein [Neobacillus sp. PS3-34]WML46905.1 S-layer homology domain-containing protein [Neobacillus sp. PS3-34]